MHKARFPTEYNVSAVLLMLYVGYTNQLRFRPNL
jgi:hypothetical protein